LSNQVDTRGLACPEPLLLTKKALSLSNSVTVVVDNEIAKDNILRYSKNQGYTVTTSTKNEDCILEIKKNG